MLKFLKQQYLESKKMNSFSPQKLDIFLDKISIKQELILNNFKLNNISNLEENMWTRICLTLYIIILALIVIINISIDIYISINKDKSSIAE